MQSRIAEELKLRHSPVAVIFTDEKPRGALEFEPGTRGCVIALLTAAARGRTAAVGPETTGCGGGRIGLGFEQSFRPGFEYFLATDEHGEGEAYIKTPELVRSFVRRLPTFKNPARWVVFKPLEEVAGSESPMAVVFYANADQLSALVVLANYGREGNEAVFAPMGAGCHTVCLYPYAESRRPEPRAVIGCTDISARPHLDPDILTFTVPWAMFREMEDNVPGSFLEKPDWKRVRARIPDQPVEA
ncbi:MAG TPA: hypothetical protein DGR79_02595 [Clostridiales bacterium]|nr:hypothetical protein [Clostridiales bacterium]